MKNLYYPNLLPQTSEELEINYEQNDNLWAEHQKANYVKDVEAGDKSYLKGIIDVTKLEANTNPSLVKTSFVGEVNEYDRNLVMAANDPMGPKTREENRIINGSNKSGIEDYLSSRDPFGLLIIVVIPIIIAIILFRGKNKN